MKQSFFFGFAPRGDLFIRTRSIVRDRSLTPYGTGNKEPSSQMFAHLCCEVNDDSRRNEVSVELEPVRTDAATTPIVPNRVSTATTAKTYGGSAGVDTPSAGRILHSMRHHKSGVHYASPSEFQPSIAPHFAFFRKMILHVYPITTHEGVITVPLLRSGG